MQEENGASDDRKIQKDILWGLFQEYRNHARHKEVMRANITNYLILISAGLLTLITNGGLKKDDMLLVAMLILVGILGALFSSSYSERYLRNRRRADEVAKELGDAFFSNRMKVTELREAADVIHESSKRYYPITKLANSHILWLTFPLLISLIGCILLTAILFQDKGSD